MKSKAASTTWTGERNENAENHRPTVRTYPDQNNLRTQADDDFATGMPGGRSGPTVAESRDLVALLSTKELPPDRETVSSA